MGCPANGSRHSMALVAETVAGTTPATPTFTPIRQTGTTLALTKETIQSQELRADRQIADMRHGNKQIGGDISCELSFGGAFDTMLEAVLCGTWEEDTPSAGTDELKAGIVRRPFTIERHFADIGQYLRYKGCEFNTWNLTVSPNAIITSNFGLVGRSMDDPAQTAISGATYDADTTASPFDSFSGTIEEGGAAIAVITELSLTLENGLSPLFVVGSDTAECISIARSNLSGSVTAWFESEALYEKFINETESSLEFTLSDGTNAYGFSLPRIKYNSGQPDVSGEGEVTISMDLMALYDETEESQIVITKGAA
ncbi:phage tail tube protein [Alcanivorax sp. DP30]|uniref:phage tail tube protein n=1 Tax=Alcanivorax sp. DP30 TaxID=2606217 RepID=UPI00136C2675|nr:phage tail tube protein [Alcanivorax sp. DP30]MZR63862.1 hypothetical protein [Alcanivorax sp. DP30]